MLQTLSIQNFALIDKLEIEFNQGHSIITGETGAGKSILLGALSLILGQRADTSTLRDKTSRCVIEGTFNIAKYNLKSFFENNCPDIDFNNTTIVRRLINPNGSSRAFVNDTPVNLSTLKEIGERLVDIHSQHKNLSLSDNEFQIKVVDTYSVNIELVSIYNSDFKKYKEIDKQLKIFKQEAIQAKSDLDYLQHRFKQLDEANLAVGEQGELEKELEALTHAEEIKHAYTTVTNLLKDDDTGAVNLLLSGVNAIEQITDYTEHAQEIALRLNSTYIELKDLASETEILANDVEFDSQRINFINERLNTIYELQQKHNVSSVEKLLEIKNTLDKKIQEIASFDFKTIEFEKKLKLQFEKTLKIAGKISKIRNKVLPEIEKKITDTLVELGMPNATFKINNEVSEKFGKNGIDAISFLFSANKNTEIQDIAKVASGGEISRVMLSLKALISKSLALPSIIFDEIDTGVSGDIANKMGNIFRQMGEGMQVINITHLPQIASKGKYHYQVYKNEEGDSSLTNIKLLNKEERIQVIAQMLSGEDVTKAALSNARELLKK